MNQIFLVVYQPGLAWKAGEPAAAQPIPEHGRYLLDLYKQGYLRLAGPFGDDTGAALVLEAPDEAQARRLVNTDPAVVQAIFSYELHPWTLVPWEHYWQRSESH
ncbi:YciI family protein [Spirosoma jeollabukense]